MGTSRGNDDDASFRCARCGYDLTGATLERCPECGGATTAREIRRPPRWFEWCAIVGLAAEFLAFGIYYTINPFDEAAFNLSTIQTTVIFSAFYYGAVLACLACIRPVRVPGVPSGATILLGFVALFALLNTYIIGSVMAGFSEVRMTLILGGLLTVNAASTMILGHRLLYRQYVETMIQTHDDATIGILGSGQLGRMLAQAGVSLGVRCRFLDATGGAPTPSSALGPVNGVGFDDTDTLARFAEGLSVVTYEFENVPVHAAKSLEGLLPVRPSSRSLEVAQDRLNERELFDRVGIPTPGHAAVESLGELKAALDAGFPLPAILKTRRLGYDGKGQARIHAIDEAEPAWHGATSHGRDPQDASASAGEARVEAMLDEMIPFVREVSIVAVRTVNDSGESEVRCYPPFENVHESGILRKSVCPAPGVSAERVAELESDARKIGDDLGHIGVFAVEFFERADGSLLANEIAPRVHNTGHGTIEGCATSQFENHLRAILGLPLGSTAARGHSAMLNIIGDWPDRRALLAIPGLSLHDYEKSPRPGRKIGHATIVAASADALASKVSDAEAVIAGSTVLA